MTKHLLITLVPLIITNMLHMVVVKKQYVNALAIPVSESLFGRNKTWRGFVFVPVVNASVLAVIVNFFSIRLSDPFFIGAVLGLAYVMAELPNSYVKRLVGIPAGERHRVFPNLFLVADKCDSAAGVALMYYLLGLAEISTSLVLFLVCSLTHAALSIFIVRINLKEKF